MSIYGELYLLMALGATTVFALGLAYYSAQQTRLDRARKAAEGRTAGSAPAPAPTPARATEQGGPVHA